MNGYADWFVRGHANYVRTPESDLTAFDLARRVRAEYVRLHQRSGQTLTIDQWLPLLNTAKEVRLKVVLVTNLSDERYEQMKALLEDARFAQHSALFSIDYGEQIAVSDQTLYGIRRMYELVRKHAPQVALTLGGWRSDPTDAYSLGFLRVQHHAELDRVIDYVDYVSLHAYNLDRAYEKAGDDGIGRGLTALVEPVVKTARSKPIVIGEFGVPSSKIPNDHSRVGDPEQQAVVYKSFLKLVQKIPFEWGVRSAWAYTLLDDGTPATKGWGIFTDGGDKRLPAGTAMREAISATPTTR